MKKLFQNPRIASVVRVIKPWVTIAVFVLVLRYTGILAGISSITGAAIIRTGVMDAEPEAPLVTKSFDYNFTLTDLENNKVSVLSPAGTALLGSRVGDMVSWYVPADGRSPWPFRHIRVEEIICQPEPAEEMLVT